MKTSDDIVQEMLERIRRRENRRDLILTLVSVLAFILLSVALLAQAGQHSIEWRDGCGRRWSTWVEDGSDQAELPLPPQLTARECRTGERER